MLSHFKALSIFVPMTWILLVIWFFALLWALSKLPMVKSSRLSFHFIAAIFLVKFIAGSALTLIYTVHYSDRGSADIYKFFDDAQVIASALPEHPSDYFKLLSGFYDEDESLVKYTNSMKNWMPQSEEWLDFSQTKNYNIFQSNRIITRINAILIPLTLGNIFTHVLIFSWFSLLGIIAFLSLFSKNDNPISYLILVLFPSLILWCSPPLKDTLTLLSVCIIFTILYKFTREGFSLKRLLIIAFAILILCCISLYSSNSVFINSNKFQTISLLSKSHSIRYWLWCCFDSFGCIPFGD
jgi:hypothetical protein